VNDLLLYLTELSHVFVFGASPFEVDKQAEKA
jgi:hypothetical protein